MTLDSVDEHGIAVAYQHDLTEFVNCSSRSKASHASDQNKTSHAHAHAHCTDTFECEASRPFSLPCSNDAVLASQNEQRRQPAHIEQLGSDIVTIAERHGISSAKVKSQAELDIDNHLCELRQLRKSLCMDQRKKAPKTIAKVLKNRARIKSQERVQCLIAERAGVKSFSAFQKGKSNTNYIPRVKSVDGEIRDDLNSIAAAFADFYTQLYTQDPEADIP